MTSTRVRDFRRRIACAGLAGAVALVGAATSHAQNGGRRMRPGSTPPVLMGDSQFEFNQINRPGTPPYTQYIGPITAKGLGYSKQSGVQLSVELHWPPSYGYVPIKLHASSAQPATRDRMLTVRLQAPAWSNSHSVAVEKTLRWPTGAPRIAATVLVPRFTEWQVMKWDVYVDGRLDEQLCADNVHGPHMNSAGGLMVLTTAENTQRRYAYEQELREALGDGAIAYNAIAADELPTEWLAYSSVDVMALPLSEFTALQQNHPQRASALLRWVRTGGNLWMENVGRDWERLVELEATLKLSATDDSSNGETDDDAAEPSIERGWHWPVAEDQPTPLAQGVVEMLQTEKIVEPSPPAANRTGWQAPAVKVPPSKEFAVRRFGMGTIAAFRTSLAVNGGQEELVKQELSHSLVAPRLSWTTRHGNSPDNSNYDFNNFLIPGVGVAPVGQFQFLITLFVIGIGPLNYWLLKRKNKLPLLLVTVPLAAGAVTLLLFAYGILADGFNTRVRVRSITLLDQQAGEAASWARLSYYAGIAPRDGLTIPSDAAMYPIMPRWERRLQRRRGVPRELHWKADEQQLTRGWLASRTPSQYLQVSARPSTKRLDLHVTDAGLTAANRLGVDVTHLAVQDREGRIYWGENLAAGQRQVFTPVERNVAMGYMRRLFTDNLPQFPSDYDAQNSSTSYGSYSMYEHGLSHNLMEAELAAINSALVDSWGDGSYIAFTKTAVETAVGVEGATEEASFHVIRGTW
jgi:hypothetical protein